MAGTGKPAPGWTFKPFVIVNDRDPPWIYTGTRFVSPLGGEVVNALLFEDRLVAEQIANHLKALGVCTGLDPSVSPARPKLASYTLARDAAHPPIRVIQADSATVGHSVSKPVVKGYVRELSKEMIRKRQYRARLKAKALNPAGVTSGPFPWSGNSA